MNDEPVFRLASGQHGVVTRSQVQQLGLAPRSLEWARDRGRWKSLKCGAYVSTAWPLGSAQRLMAAILTTGGVASHCSAGWAWGLRYVNADHRAHVTVPLGRSARSPLAVVHRRMLDPAWSTMRDGFPVVCVAVALLDAAAGCGRGRAGAERFGRMLDDALDRRLVSLDELVTVLGPDSTGRRGSALLRRSVEERGDGARTESVLERRFLRLCADAGLPRPETQVSFGWRANPAARSDVVFVEQRCIVELDGRRGHTQLGHRADDLERDAEAAANGYVTVRFTWEQVSRRPDLVIGRLMRILSNFERSRRPGLP